MCGTLLRGGVATLWLILHVASVSAQDGRWDTATTAGVKAFDQEHYAAAAQQFQAALTLTAEWPPDDPRVSISFMNLAIVYETQGEYTRAASLYQHALTLQEQMLGPAHPQLVAVLKAYANIQRKLYPWRSRLPWSTASQMAARAKRIEEREASAGLQEPPGVWFGDLSANFFGGTEP